MSWSRALFCIRRVHLRDLRVRRGDRVRRGLVPSVPLLGTSHSSSGWSGGVCCCGRARRCRCRCAGGGSCCDGGHGCDMNRCRASDGSLGGGLSLERALSRSRNPSSISFLMRAVFLFHLCSCLLRHSDQFLSAPAVRFTAGRRVVSFFSFIFCFCLVYYFVNFFSHHVFHRHAHQLYFLKITKNQMRYKTRHPRRI